MNPDAVILYAVDFSEMTDYVIQAAIDLAKNYQRPSLHAVCVIVPSDHLLATGPPPEFSDERVELDKALRARIGPALARAGHPLDAPLEWTVCTHVCQGRPAAEIERVASEIRADTIVLGRHGSAGFRPFLLGSVPSRLLAVARCTVMVVQPTNYPSPAPP